MGGHRVCSMASGRMKFKADFEKSVLVQNFEKRGWSRAQYEDDWNFYWANVHNVKALFSPDNPYRLGDHQVVNHYPNHYELTRKDLMVKNMKRFKKEAQNKSQAEREAGAAPEADLFLDFVPITFTLPADYTLFVEEFRRNPNWVWIVKPSNCAQGKGIFLLNKLSQVKKWSAGKNFESPQSKSTYVISRYIDNPLLVGGKKFDLRIYALVTSYRPLTIYVNRNGFARFCTVKYSNDTSELDNNYMHLTNVAIQKHGNEYNDRHGGKWSMHNLVQWLEAVRGREATAQMVEEIEAIIVNSCRSVQHVIINDRHCFELYGYDVIIDDNLKPWLVEVNASPSLNCTTLVDRQLKGALINDVLNIVASPEVLLDSQRSHTPHVVEAREKLGDFDLLYSEASRMEAERARKEPAAAATRKAPGFGGRRFQR